MLESLSHVWAGVVGGAVVAIGGMALHKAQTGMRARKLRLAISLLKGLQEQPTDTEAAEVAARQARESALTAQAKVEAAKLV